MIVPSVDKVRGADGKVIGFRDRATGQPLRMYPSAANATRKRRLMIHAQRLVQFLLNDTHITDSELEHQAIGNISDAIGLLKKAADQLEAEDARILRFQATDA